MIVSINVQKIITEILCFGILANQMKGHYTVIRWDLLKFSCIEDGPEPEELIDSGYCNEFDPGTPGLSASEASLEAKPDGDFMYGVCAQWAHDENTGNSSSLFRWPLPLLFASD